jgi:hypothetical protein
VAGLTPNGDGAEPCHTGSKPSSGMVLLPLSAPAHGPEVLLSRHPAQQKRGSLQPKTGPSIPLPYGDSDANNAVPEMCERVSPRIESGVSVAGPSVLASPLSVGPAHTPHRSLARR